MTLLRTSIKGKINILKMMSTLPPHEDESSEDKPAAIASNKQKNFTKCSLIKNLVIVAVGTFLLLGSEDILLMYQSTMNSDEGIGVHSVAVLYASSVLSSLFLPKYLIQRFGCKAVLVLSMVTYAPFYLANYSPILSLMILTSALLGAGCSLFKASVDLYISDIAATYAKLMNGKSDSDLEIQPVVYCKPGHMPTESEAPYDKQLSNLRMNEELQIERKPIEYIKLSGDFNYTSLLAEKFVSYSNKGIDKSQSVVEPEIEKKQMKSISASELKYRNPTQSVPDIIAANNLYNSLDERNTETQDIVPNVISYNISNSEVLNINAENVNNHIVNDTEFIKKQNRTFETPNSNIGNINLNPVNKDTTNSTGVEHPNKTDILSSVDLYTIKFFGFHSMVYQTCYVCSNLVSFYVLQTGYSSNQMPGLHNSTCSCGATYCNADDDVCSEQNLQQPTPKTRNLLFSMCVALCIIGAVLVIVFLDKFRQKDKSVKVSLRILFATLHQMKRKEQLLLVPMNMNNGMMKGFFLADFTKSYIGCAWGIRQIGLVAAFSGGAMAFFSLMSGWFVKRLGRRLVFTVAGILNFVLNLIFLLWSPDPSQPAMFFVTAGLWGGLFGTFHTQVRAFHGVLFRKDEEAAFAAYQLWYCIGSCLCLAFSNILCNTIKIYIFIFFALMGTVGYWMIELFHFRVKTIVTSHKNTSDTKSAETPNGFSYSK